MATASSLSDRPTSAYKAAVDHFIQTGSKNCVTAQDTEDTSPPNVPESQTRLLQQLIGSAQTLTAKEDLLNKLRSDKWGGYDACVVGGLPRCVSAIQHYSVLVLHQL